jgi:Uma2 family endonuclease
MFPQNALHAGPHNVPQPDLAILHAREDFYRSKLPTAEDAFLVIEVADSSLWRDLRRKVPIYARCGVAEVWVVNLSARQVDVFREPIAGEYTVHLEVGADESLSPTAFPDESLSVGALLG